MRVLDLSGHYQRRVQIDTCQSCCLVWFDDTESLRLAGPGVADLVREIHAAMGGSLALGHAVSLARVQRCPVCRAQLKTVHNQSRFGRTMLLECPQGHGYYQTYILYLAEKGFVRPLAWADVRDMLAQGRTLFCANCGAPLPARPVDCCPACQSAIGVIDPARLASAIDIAQAATLIEPLAATLPPARARQVPCHACGGPIDPTRDLRCPHCNAPVLPVDTGDAVAAALAVDAAVRANYAQQHPAVSRARLAALAGTRPEWDDARPAWRLDSKKIQMLAALLVAAIGIAVFKYYRSPAQQAKWQPQEAPLMKHAIAFKPPHLNCAADAGKRREVLVRQLVITPGAQTAQSNPVATMGAMRAAYARAMAARDAWFSGVEFDTLLPQYSNLQAGARSVPPDYFSRGHALPAVERAAFCLPVDDISPIFLAEDGFHILQVVDAH